MYLYIYICILGLIFIIFTLPPQKKKRLEFLKIYSTGAPCFASGGKIPFIFAFFNSKIAFLPPGGARVNLR